MGSHLNIIGSIIIGGLLLLTINRYNSSTSQNSQEKLLDSISIYNASGISKVIEFDFNRMGLGVTKTVNPLVLADSNRITFLADIDENKAVDSVRYILSDVSAASKTENPRDRILYRLVNNQAQEDAALGVIEFKIRYFDAVCYETADLAQIRTFEITLSVESTVPINGRYSTFHWQTRISPPNL